MNEIELPKFASEQEELEWWDEHHDEIDYDALPIQPFTFDRAPPIKKGGAAVSSEKTYPKFASEDEERAFLDENDPFEYFTEPADVTVNIAGPRNVLEARKILDRYKVPALGKAGMPIDTEDVWRMLAAVLVAAEGMVLPKKTECPDNRPGARGF